MIVFGGGLGWFGGGLGCLGWFGVFQWTRAIKQNNEEAIHQIWASSRENLSSGSPTK